VTDELADFRNFLFRAWEVLGLPPPTRLQYDVAYHMQHGPDRLVLLCFRGFGKSWIGTTRGCHALYMDKERKFLNISAAKKKADDSTRFMLDLIRIMPELNHLYPDMAQRSSNVEFDVYGCMPAHAPSVRSLGILSNAVTGSRADDILADDIESKENSQTMGMRTKIREKAKELGGAVVRSATEISDPKICYLGTPQIEESLYFDLEKAGYEVMIYPARYPDEKTQAIYGGRLAQILVDDLKENPDLVGQPTESNRFSDGVLLERQAEFGRHGWQLQFSLLPTLAREDAYPLRLNDLVVMDLDDEVGPEKVIWTSSSMNKVPDVPCVGFSKDFWHGPAELVGKHMPYTGNVMSVDTSAGGRDECAFAVLKVLNSQVFLLDCGGFKDGSDESTMRQLAKISARWGITKVLCEKNFGLGMWSQLFLPFVREHNPGCSVEDVHVTGRKEIRIAETLEPLLASHRLVVNRSAIQNDYDSSQRYSDSPLGRQLFYQVSRLTRDRHCLEFDDRLDALALGVSHFQETMAKDYRAEMRERHVDELDKQLEDWCERMDTPQQKQTWTTLR
jgi:hypothetical protein